jgi:hypothetical protein
MLLLHCLGDGGGCSGGNCCGELPLLLETGTHHLFLGLPLLNICICCGFMEIIPVKPLLRIENGRMSCIELIEDAVQFCRQSKPPVANRQGETYRVASSDGTVGVKIVKYRDGRR